MAKASKPHAKRWKITFTEAELRGLLESEHARGYKQGADSMRAGYQSALDTCKTELREANTRTDLLEQMIAGLAPAATALARLAKGD